MSKKNKTNFSQEFQVDGEPFADLNKAKAKALEKKGGIVSVFVEGLLFGWWWKLGGASSFPSWYFAPLGIAENNS